ncbi:hypothetical protein ACJQWK_03603 [Exserohilum turcicum]
MEGLSGRNSLYLQLSIAVVMRSAAWGVCLATGPPNARRIKPGSVSISKVHCEEGGRGGGLTSGGRGYAQGFGKRSGTSYVLWSCVVGGDSGKEPGRTAGGGSGSTPISGDGGGGGGGG